MLRVGYKITIGSTIIQPSTPSHLLSVETSATIDVPVSCCRIGLDSHTQLIAAAGDLVQVELGYGNNLPLVFTGKLDTIEASSGQICLAARGVFADLVAACPEGVYEQQPANFTHYVPHKTYLFTYGGDILEYHQIGQGPGLDVVRPPGRGEGGRASHWLTSENVRSTTDTAAPPSPARGRLRARGAPAVQLGDAVQLSQLPDSAQNGTFKVTGVRHQLSRSSGFITDIFWEQD